MSSEKCLKCDMKVLQVNTKSHDGGAAVAMNRICEALKHYDVEIQYVSDDDVTKISKTSKYRYLIKRYAEQLISKQLLDLEQGMISLSIFGSVSLTDYEIDAELTHMHWLNGEFLSIPSIKKAKKPMLWTLHDMWPLNGVYHYTDKQYWSYTESKKEASRIELFQLKRLRSFVPSNITVVSPSRWLSDLAKESEIFHENECINIPNAINTDFWKRVDQEYSKSILGLDLSRPVVAVGAMGLDMDLRKGFDLFKKSINSIDTSLQILAFGSKMIGVEKIGNHTIHYLGRIQDDISMKIIYSASDVFVISSRMDNLPNTGLEALSIGVPIVGFRVGGIPDIIETRVNGMLVEPYNTDEMGDAILNCIENYSLYSRGSRSKAESKFSLRIVGKEYKTLYDKLIQSRL